MQDLDPVELYRLPWSLTDNSISWLEPTSKCNLYCDGCYRENKNDSHKSLDQIRSELQVFAKNRRTDSISIAGGEPLTHPNIIEIVRIVKSMGWKPMINSNGDLLTKELIIELKKAGLFGFTLHVDSGQKRKGWTGKNEIEINKLRQKLANMIADVGGLTCSFNMTEYPETMKYLPELTKWAQDNIDKVHTMVFILYRMAVMSNGFDYYAKGKKVKFDDMMYSANDDSRRTNIKAIEAVNEIRKEYPDFKPSAYLNGTIQPDSFKWLLTGRFGNKHEVFGYIGPKFMELMQVFKHLFTDKYLAYSSPKLQKGFFKFLIPGLFDRSTMKALKNYLLSFFLNPKAFFNGIKYQSVMIIQPVDVLQNGDQNMCDGCPDMTVWNGKLVWSCRMEEQNRWGENVKMFPSSKN